MRRRHLIVVQEKEREQRFHPFLSTFPSLFSFNRFSSGVYFKNSCNSSTCTPSSHSSLILSAFESREEEYSTSQLCVDDVVVVPDASLLQFSKEEQEDDDEKSKPPAVVELVRSLHQFSTIDSVVIQSI
jgi:hypothetical protein